MGTNTPYYGYTDRWDAASQLWYVKSKGNIKLLFFFVDKKTGQTSLKQLLLTFWDQLHRDPFADNHDDDSRIAPGDSRDKKIDRCTNRELVEKLLEKLHESPECRVCITVDAFEELPLPEQTELLENFVKRCRDIIRVSTLISYRTGSEPREATWIANREICVGKTENEADMRKYLIESLREKLPRSRTIDREQGEENNREKDVREVADEIWERANGMFLWAAVSVHKVWTARNREQAELSLRKVTIRDDYEEIVAKWEEKTMAVVGCSENPYQRAGMEEWQRRLAQQATAMLTHPTGLLSVAALAEAAALDIASKRIDDEVRSLVMKYPMTVVWCCSPFVEYDRQLNVFRFYHTSMHDYFLSRPASVARLANLTLAYLCQPELDRGPSIKACWYDLRDLQRCLVTHPYLEFASTHWVTSVRANMTINMDNEEPTKRLLAELYRSPENLRLAFQLSCFQARVSMPTGLLPAHIFSYFGLIDRLPSSNNNNIIPPEPTAADATAPDGDGRTPLHWAMRCPDPSKLVPTATRLLALHPTPTTRRAAPAAAAARDARAFTPLHYAARRGHLAAVKLLLDSASASASAAADRQLVDARSKRVGTPLWAAARGGHADVVEELLRRGADPNVKSKLGTALHAAAASGSERCVEVLTSGGDDGDDGCRRIIKARRDAYGDGFGTPVHTAAYYGYPGIVRVLLGRGFSARKKSWGYGGTVTAAAVGCYEGKDPRVFVEVLEQLLGGGAKVDAPGEKRETGLHYAARFGHAEVVEFLLMHGADARAESPVAGTPFEIADDKGNTAAMEVLRRYGGEVGSKTRRKTCDRGGGHRARKMTTAIWVPVWLVALANDDMKLMYNLIETYERVCQRAIRKDHQPVIQRLAPLGTTVFSLVVDLVARREQQRQQQQRRPRRASKMFKQTDEHASSMTAAMRRLKENAADRIETVLCYFGLKAVKNERRVLHSSAIPSSSTLGPDSQLKQLYDVLDRLTVAAVCVLGAAFALGNNRAVLHFANAWTDALQTVAVARGGPELLKGLVEQRARQLKTILVADKPAADKLRDAGNLASVGIELLVAALQRGPAYAPLARGLAQLWAATLCDAGDPARGGVRMEDVFHVLQTFLAMFRAALDPPDRDRVALLANVGAEIMVEAVNTGNQGLIDNIQSMMDVVRGDAERAEMGHVVEGVLAERRKGIGAVGAPGAEGVGGNSSVLG
ncbi:uncharacterized protein BKCO1_3300017 [Diplodia corticola]|uniref:Uncharacterized protein n=1 Tax=Diplodia corticola TaxID=236234 RepID=A0A1J9QXM4_9PEZI|nr:uncharacterized protein BKCO1_3300017 [Diplodia corticola]OJD33129.1 hypothetical protein BKCO1_3300017 [Diplodia corticola]